MRILIVDDVSERLEFVASFFRCDARFEVFLADFVSETSTFEDFDVILIMADDTEYSRLILYYIKQRDPDIFIHSVVITLIEDSNLNGNPALELGDDRLRVYLYTNNNTSLLINIEYIKTILNYVVPKARKVPIPS